MNDRQLVEKICSYILLTSDLEEALELTYLLESVIKDGIKDEGERRILRKYSSTFNELPS